MRRTEQSIDRASALASLVLPTPGTSSISRCPSAACGGHGPPVGPAEALHRSAGHLHLNRLAPFAGVAEWIVWYLYTGRRNEGSEYVQNPRNGPGDTRGRYPVRTRYNARMTRAVRLLRRPC